jgi:phosphoglycerate dehydrogenase-like enzyme
MKSSRFLVLTPPQDGLQTVQGATRYLHGGKRIRDLADAALGPHGEVRHLGWEPGTPLDESIASLDGSLPDADALVMAPWLLPWPGVFELPVFDSDRFQRAADLKVIAGTFDLRLSWIDLDAAARGGVTVIDTSRTMTPTVAEFGVGITLALLRDIPGAIDVVRSGGWFDSPPMEGSFVFRDLADCRVGLAGYGSINRHFRRYIRPYGCEVGIYDPFVSEDVATTNAISRASSLVELARTSDIMVVAIPPTPTTVGVIDASVIDALADGSLFVLLSRMAVVEQDALWRRIRAGELRAAIDVFDPEPPPSDAWFRRAANVLPTPHIAGSVQFAHERCFTEACADAVRVVSGEAPHHPATVRDKRLYQGAMGSRAGA